MYVYFILALFSMVAWHPSDGRPDDIYVALNQLKNHRTNSLLETGTLNDIGRDRAISVLEALLESVIIPDTDCYRDVLSTIAALVNIGMDVTTGNSTDAAKYLWVLTLLDAQGNTQPRGVLQGNHFDLGNYHECIQIGDVAPYDGMQCTASVFEQYLGAVPLYVMRGFCVPNSCSDGDVNRLLRYTSAMRYALLHQNVTLDVQLARDLVNFTIGLLSPNGTIDLMKILDDIQNIGSYGAKTFATAYNTTLQENPVCHRPLDMTTDAAAISVICILALLGIFMVIGTLYDYFSYQTSIKDLPDKNNDIERKCTTKKELYDSLPLILKCLMAFSVYTNLPKIFDTTRRQGTLDCIHGIRFLSMTWVMVGHVYLFSIGTMDNPVRVLDSLGQFASEAIANATLSVDTFFLISGILLAYLWFRETDRKDGKNIRSPMHWIMYYVHRYIRLTPAYMMIIGVLATLTAYLSDGPLWDQAGYQANCFQNWWRNMLYIQNFFKGDEICIGVSWYLANDMQFYAVAPIFLVITYFWPVAGLAIGIAIMTGSAVGRGYISGVNNMVPMGGLVANPSEFNYTVSQIDTLYFKPWFRVGPYAIGIIVGYLLFQTLKKRESFKLKPWVNFIGWFFASGIALSVLYGMYDVFGKGELLPRWANGFYTGISRTVWAMAVGWVCFACSTGNGGIVNSILSWSGFVPLSRLTYCTYLTHVTLLKMYLGNCSAPIRFEGHITFIYLFFATMIAAYSVSLVFSLMLEAPVLILEKLLIPVGGNSHPKTKTHNRMQPKNDFITSEATIIPSTGQTKLPNGIHNRNYSTSTSLTITENVLPMEPLQNQQTTVTF